jgi:hypothetical protein
MKIKRLPRLFESRLLDPPKMGPSVSLSLLIGYWQYYNPEKGCPPLPPYYFL